MAVALTLYTFGRPVQNLPPPVSTLAAGGTTSTSTVTAPTVSFDTTSSVLRTGSLSLVDPTGTLIPGVNGNTTLLPAGNEILIQTTDQAGQLVDLGLLGIVQAEVDDSVDTASGQIGPVVTVGLSDRSYAFSVNTPTDTVQYPNGIPLEAATYLLLHSACPWVPDWCYQLDSTGITLPAQIVTVGANPWTTAATWWAAAGGRLYCDGLGRVVGTVAPLSPVPYGVYAPGGVNLVTSPTNPTGIAAVYDRQGAYNGVTVAASNPGVVPVQATAWDTDSNSPTYYLGPFGQCPTPPIQSDTASSYSQCLAAAVGLLPRYLGLIQTVETTLVPDPHLLPWATGQITSPKDGVTGLWYAQSGVFTLDNSSSHSVVWVPSGRPLNWGQSGQ